MTERLKMVANFVHKDTFCVADVGCDHCYTSIYMIENGIAQKVIACDINEGPLAIGKRNIDKKGLNEKIETRVGGGLSVIRQDEIDCILISGMGGILICSILDECPNIVLKADQIVVQPQRDIDMVRRCIHLNNFKIEKEDMVFEDGQFYTVISAVQGLGQEKYNDCEYEFGKILIETKNSVFKCYLEKRILKYENILKGVSGVKAKEINNTYKKMKEVYQCL